MPFSRAPRARRAAFAALVALVALGALAAGRAEAQYFGRNKVQYQTFRFQVLATEHFDVYFYPEERTVAEQAGRMAERWYVRLSRALGHELRGRQPLILYASHPHFEQTNAIPGELDESTGGVTESFKRRIVLPLGASLAEIDHVLGHELVHAFQFDLRRRGESSFVEPGLQMPLWFVEGMAEYLSVGPGDPHTAMWMRDAARQDKLPSIAKLDQWRYFPYRFGQALWAFVASRYGEERVAEVYRAAARGGVTVDRAFESVFGFPADSLSREWQQATKEWATGVRGAPVVEGGTSAEPVALGMGRLLLGPRGERGRINVSPSLSPDGSRIAFLSERDAFSIELFVADAGSGRVLRRLTKSVLDPHLQSLQFIRSAGAWSPDGRRIAVATVHRGKPALAVLDAGNGRTVQRITLGDLGEIYHPTWSPDGARVAFSGLAGGMSDLFVVDLATRKTRRLTQDLYADLQPAWSPDGRSLAFATDRFSTELERLRYGELQIALMDLDGSAPRVMPGADQGKNVNPQWSRDGSSLYFVSDRTGISNVYRLELGSSGLYQATDVATGVSGITASSPALSVARAADRAVFSVFEDGGYRLHALDGPGALAGVAPRPGSPRAGILPPALGDAAATAVTRSDSLPDTTAFKRSRYRAGLSLDSVGQVGLGVAAGSGGVAVGGGSAFFWSDMLGDHNLATQFQISSSAGGVGKNLAAIAAYQNLKRRWNWGVSAAQIPYFSRLFEFQEDQTTQILTARDVRYWEIDRRVQGIVAYPLSRAQRLELGVGYRNVDFESEVETQVYSLVTGQLLSETTAPGVEDSIPSLDLVEGLAAMVYDNSVFGGTSPVVGQRYRFEVSPVAGNLQYVGVLGDYRRYLRLGGPFTLAGRGLHLGRYGRDSDTDRIQSLYIGYPWLVRGYDASSFTLDECGGGTGNDCPAYDQLFGSRVAIGNVELRMPVFGALGAVYSPMVPPIEAAAFYDVGVAWTDAEEARFLGGDRGGVSSYGGSLRINLLGFAVAEISYVHPNQRPVKGWYWLFALQPGF
jgi:Tol biopolymer transport system component